MRNNNTTKIILILFLAVIAVRLVKNFSTPKHAEQDKPKQEQVDTNTKTTQEKEDKPTNNDAGTDIASLTDETKVVAYVKANHQLPEYYITKKEARKNGWNPAQGNLCEVLPGKAIGGDIFTNREGRLPGKPGRKWYEADLNYNCEHRNADRLLFSSDGLVYVTKDHYKTFDQK